MTTRDDESTRWRSGSDAAPHGAESKPAPPDEKRCTARSKSTGERCRQLRMRGATVCRHHGGAARQVRSKAAERLAAAKVQAQVDATLAHEALERVDNPIEALGRLAVEALALKSALAARVNALQDLRAAGSGVEQLRVEVALYERALDRSAKFLDLLAKNNWEEKRIELEQARAQLVVAAFLAAVGELDLVPADRDRAVRSFLRALGREVPEVASGSVVGEVSS